MFLASNRGYMAVFHIQARPEIRKLGSRHTADGSCQWHPSDERAAVVANTRML